MFLTLKATAAEKGANESKSEGGVDLEKKGPKGNREQKKMGLFTALHL